MRGIEDLANLLWIYRSAKGASKPKLSPVSWSSAAGKMVMLASWDVPHATGYTSHMVSIKVDQIPEFCTILMAQYVEFENARKAELVVKQAAARE